MRGILRPIDGKQPAGEETIRGVPPTRTVGESYAPTAAPAPLAYLELLKLRVTSLVMLTAWAGYFLAARKTGAALLSWKLLAALAGVGIVSAGAAALNQVLEREADARMSRTKSRPLPTHRISVAAAAAVGVAGVFAGTALLTFSGNPLTGALTLGTALAYVLIYTPLKQKTTLSTFIGAFPGAMPPVLGWTAVTGTLGWEALALFGIVFFWQFPHFLAIAWLYREDYARAGIKMVPVMDATGRRTVAEILFYGVLLIPMSLAPLRLGMAGWIYAGGAMVLGIAYLMFGVRLAMLRLPPSAAHSKRHARELLQASVIYLPLLFGLLMASGGRGAQ